MDVVGLITEIVSISIYAILLVCGVGAVAFVIWLKKFKIKFRVRTLTGSKRIVEDDKAAVIKDKEGVECWKLWKRKHKVPIPPHDVIDIDRRGKMVVEAYYTEQGGYTFIKDETDFEDVEESKLQPLTTSDREFYLNQLRKADANKGFNWKENVPMLAGGMFLLIMMLLVFMFWEDITAPSLEAQRVNAGIVKDHKEITSMLKEIIKQEQIIKGSGSAPG